MPDNATVSCPDEDTLNALVAGLLTPTTQAELEAHLDACPLCFDLLAEFARLAVPDPDPDPAEVPHRFGAPRGRYVPQRILGVGAMGLVYEAHDTALDRPVAVKMLLDTTPEFRTRLAREAQALASLSHPNVVAVFDANADDDVYVVTELVEGGTLHQWLRRPPIPSLAQTLDVLIAAAEGLAAAHAAGLVHRDVSPNNILVGADGRARVSDFGLARSEAGNGSLEDTRSGGTTLRGVGTPGYIAPEVLGGASATPHSDQYSLCAVAREALSRAEAAEGGRPRVASVRARAAIDRGLSDAPRDRHRTMPKLITALRRARAANARPTRARLLLGGAALTTLLVLAVWGLSPAPPGPPTLARAASGRCLLPPPGEAPTWNETTIARVRARFAATHPEARAGAHAVLPGLQTLAEDWTAQWRLSCTPRAPMPPAVATCLRRRRNEFDFAVQFLTTMADDTDLRRASAVTDGLTSARGCGRVPAQAPSDPPQAAELARQLDELSVLRSAGRYTQAHRRAAALAERAQALGLPRLYARAAYLTGSTINVGSDDETAAERWLTAAFETATTVDDARLASDAAIELMTLTSHRHDLEDALRWGRHARALADRAQRPRQHARLDVRLARVYRVHGQLESSLHHARRGLARWTDLEGQHGTKVAVARSTLGNTLVALAQYDEATAVLQTAIDDFSVRADLHEERIANARTSLGAIAFLQGDLDDALGHFEAARRLLIRAWGEQHRMVASADANLAAVLLSLDRPEQAERHLRHALTVATRSHGGSDYRLVAILSNLGRAQSLQGDYASAEQTLWRAVVLAQEHGREGEANHRTALRGLASAYRATGDEERADALLKRERAAHATFIANSRAAAGPL